MFFFQICICMADFTTPINQSPNAWCFVDCNYELIKFYQKGSTSLNMKCIDNRILEDQKFYVVKPEMTKVQWVFFVNCLNFHCLAVHTLPSKSLERPRKAGFGQYWHESFSICDNFALIRDNTNYENIFYYINSLYIEKNLNFKCNICKLSDLNCVLIGSLYYKLNWQSIVEAIKVCWPQNLLKTWAKFKPVTRHHSWQRGMSDFDVYIAFIM